jgi:O-antigen ligase
MNTKNSLLTNYPLDFIYLILLATFPLALIIGNFFINLYIVLFSISFFKHFKTNKSIFRDLVYYLLVFFFISLLINIFFSLNIENSYPRVIKIFFIICFIFEIKRLIQKYDNTHIQNVYKFWFLIFLVLSIDVLFEATFGYNIVGNKSYMPGRIASFFGDELIIGAFYHGFVLFFISYLIKKKIKNHFLIFSIIIIFLISFLIGERSNFFKLFISVLFFTAFAMNINYKIKIISLLAVILTLSAFLNLNNSYKIRYFDQIKILLSKNGYSNYLKKSQYGAHRDVSMKIFREYFIFGVGIKNFRHESGKKYYENQEYLLTDLRQATHPHQIHHEFLSETGVFGYSCFLIFILSSIYLGFKSYLKTKNLYQLSAIIFIITSLLPLLPSGSFLSTYVSGIFWLNFAIMNSYIQQTKLNFNKI